MLQRAGCYLDGFSVTLLPFLSSFLPFFPSLPPFLPLSPSLPLSSFPFPSFPFFLSLSLLSFITSSLPSFFPFLFYDFIFFSVPFLLDWQIHSFWFIYNDVSPCIPRFDGARVSTTHLLLSRSLQLCRGEKVGRELCMWKAPQLYMWGKNISMAARMSTN